MDLAGAILVVVGFTICLYYFRIVDKTRTVVDVARSALDVVRDPRASDAEKERRLRAGSLQLFRILLYLVIGTAAAIAIPLLVVWAGAFAGLVSFDAVLDLLIRWDFVASATVIGLALYFLLAWLA